MRGPSCLSDWGGPRDQDLRTKGCDLLWNQIHFLDVLCFSQLPLPVHNFSCPDKTYFCGTYFCAKLPGASLDTERGDSLGRGHMFCPFYVLGLARLARGHLPCLSHLSPCTHLRSPPPGPLPMGGTNAQGRQAPTPLRESTEVLENPVNLKQKPI